MEGKKKSNPEKKSYGPTKITRTKINTPESYRKA
jgi:hypothetical protein